MSDTTSDAPVPLTAEQAKRIFPISVRDRRENRDLFADILSDGADHKDDAAFYVGLARLLNGEGTETLRRYDQRMKTKGDEKKGFIFRCLRSLRNGMSQDVPFEELIAAPDEYFQPGSIQKVLIYLCMRLQGLEEPQQPPAAEAASEDLDLDEGRDWRECARRLSEAVQQLASPDVAAAERIAAMAKALTAACRTAEVEALAERRSAETRARLALFDAAIAEAWPETPATDLLERVEALLNEAEAAKEGLEAVLKTQAALKAQARRAQEAEDLDAEERILAERRVAQMQAQGLSAAAERIRLKLAELLAAIPTQDPEPNSSAPPERPAPAEDSEDGSEVGADEETEAAPPAKGASSSASAPLLLVAEEPASPAPALVAPEIAPLEAEAPIPVEEKLPTSNDADGAEAEALLADYLERDEIAFAWHLTRLAAPEDPPPVPPEILRGLAILRGVRKAEDMADQRRSGAMAEMMAALPQAGHPLAAGRLVLAALLRPALFDPDHGARGLIAHLPRDGGLEEMAPLIDVLAGLGHDMRLSAQSLADLVGVERPAALSEAQAALSDWSLWAQNRKTKYQPAYSMFHRELRPNGVIGAIIEATACDKPGASDQARDFVERLSGDRSAQEAWILEAEQRKRLSRDRIEGAAQDWLCSRLQEACDHLADWLEARGQDPAAQDRNHDKLSRVAGALRKALDQVEPQRAASSDPLTEVSGRLLALGLKDLRALLDGAKGQTFSHGSGDAQDAPLLRLPGGCQDWTEGLGAEQAERERGRRDRRLRAALRRPACVAPDLRTAFAARLSEEAILSAHALLESLRREGAPESELQRLEQELSEKQDSARRRASERVERLRQSFTTLSYLDLETSAELRGELAGLAAVAAALKADPQGDQVALPALSGIRAPETPPDFPELDATLAELEERRDHLRAQIGARQREALQALCVGPAEASARAILARIDRLDPVTVDDAIAELTAGREAPLSEPGEPDAFQRFHPVFLEALEAADEQTSRGKVMAAVREGAAVGPLDFSAMDRRGAERVRNLLEAWGAAENAMKQTKIPQLRGHLAQIFGSIGMTGLNVADGRETIQGRMRSFILDFDQLRPSDWFLPPVFGSASGGRYRLLVARDGAMVEQMLRQIGAEAPDSAWVLLFFGRFGVHERRNLARRMRSEGRAALILDEALLLYLCLRPEDPLSIFFTCAPPFAWVQPYTTDPGQIPPEIFFGRQEEIERITARGGGGSLIYGGRQLGKSALLNHIRRERHRPAQGELAVYLDIKPLGGVGAPPQKIWDEFAHELRGVPDLHGLSSDANELLERLNAWLSADPSRRIIAMFDEADNFLRAEHAAGYPNLQKLKQLMERTERRFKIVFAGLHSVRRLAAAPNSPLPHLGDPICIGPMNQTAENRVALRRLATLPMQAAGLDYADPDLASDMLARMNYYPSLVQVFGRQIVESVGRRPMIGASGPRWLLDRETLFEGAAAERIATQIRERFQLTLNLDLRYESVAKSIALHRLDAAGGDAQVLSQGLTAGEIRKIAYWPRSAEEPSNADFEELLREMVDLGVLGAFSNGRYGLRNAQVAQMLGQRDALEAALLALDEREHEPAYDAALFHAALRPASPEERAPLSDRALRRLFTEQQPGVRVVVGSPEIAGERLAQRLKIAADIFQQDAKVNHPLVRGDDNALRRAIDGATAAPTFLIIEGPWSAEIAAGLMRQQKVAQGKVRPIWLLDHPPPDFSEALVFRAGVWSESMVRHWLDDEGLTAALDDPTTRAALLAASGGAPARLTALRPLLSEIATLPVAERSARLADWARKRPLSPEALKLDEEDLRLLRLLAEYGEAMSSWDDFANVGSEASAPRVERLEALGCLRIRARPEDPPRLTHLGMLLQS